MHNVSFLIISVFLKVSIIFFKVICQSGIKIIKRFNEHHFLPTEVTTFCILYFLHAQIVFPPNQSSETQNAIALIMESQMLKWSQLLSLVTHNELNPASTAVSGKNSMYYDETRIWPSQTRYLFSKNYCSSFA